MEQEGKPKRKKLLLEIVALKRDVHKYHTLYEKQKEYCEDKLQELIMLESKHRELEHKCRSQEDEIERLYQENLEHVKTIGVKNQELEVRKSELSSVISSCQELSKILLLVDKHLQFLETENFVDSRALHLTVQDIYPDMKNKNKSSSKVAMEPDCNFPGVDKTILTAEGLMANWEAGINHCRLTSLEIEKERLSRLLNHPQMCGAKSDSVNTDNNNISKEAEQFLKNSSVIWSTLEGTNANSVSTKDLIDKFKEKLQHCQYNLKKDREKNKSHKDELIKLTEKLQKDLESSVENLEALRSQDRAVRDHAKGLEIEIEKLQQEMKIKAEEIESRNQAIKALTIQNNQWKEQHSKKEKEIKMLMEKFKVMEFVNKTRNKMYEDKLIQLMSTSCKSQSKLKSKMVQTDQTHERIISDVSKYQLILTVQELLKKLIEKSEEVIKLETLLKKKCLIVKNLVTQSLEISKKSRIDNRKIENNERKTIYSLKSAPLSKPAMKESENDDYDSTEDETSQMSPELEELGKTIQPVRHFSVGLNESMCKSNSEKSINYDRHYHHHFYKDSVENYMQKSKAVKDHSLHGERFNGLPVSKSMAKGYTANDAIELSSSKSLDLRKKEPQQRRKELSRKVSDCKSNTQCPDKVSGDSLNEAKRAANSPKRRISKRPSASLQPEPDMSARSLVSQQPRTGRRSSQSSRTAALQDEQWSSENLDTVDEFAESSDQERNHSCRKLGHEISKFLKQQNSEVNRSQQNNSSSMLSTAEFYVILKGHRKKSS